MTISIRISGEKLIETKADMLAVSVVAPGGSEKHGSLSKQDGGEQLDTAMDGWLSQLIVREQFRGDVGTSRVVPLPAATGTKYVLLVGAGCADQLTAQDMRIMGAKLGQAAECLRLKSIAGVLVNASINDNGPAVRLQALIEGIILGTYRFTKYKTSGEPSTVKTITIIAGGNRTGLEKTIATAQVTAAATCLARDLVNTTAADLTPYALATVAKDVARKNKLKVSVMTGKDLAKNGMRLISAVGQGSPNPPAFIHLSYKPRGKAKRKIALVGKGITFDTGGLDLKLNAGMITMKNDMAGAAAVLATMQAIAQLKPEVAVDAYIPTAENAIDGNAYRSSDVIKSRSGKTVEVGNTDAEGRLVLADALDYAVEGKPDVVVDVATLTGGIVVALGEQCAGIFSNQENMAEKMMAAADSAGELMWRMPLLKVYEEGLKSKVADLSSIGKSRASAVTAALFLKQFVKDTPWIHLDIAGSAWAPDNRTLTPAGGTGVAVRTLIEFCRG